VNLHLLVRNFLPKTKNYALQKITLEDVIIEFHNNWLGKEIVIVNGHVVSKKSSVWGAHHDFTLLENGHPMNYILTTKVNGKMQVFIDLRKNGKIIREDVAVGFGGRPKMPKNNFKKKGIELIRSYAIREGITELKKSLELSLKDAEIYFHLACAYFIEEEVINGFESLKMAVKYHLQNMEAILNEDMLAYLRMNEEFENFLNSDFTEYDKEKILSRGEKS